MISIVSFQDSINMYADICRVICFFIYRTLLTVYYRYFPRQCCSCVCVHYVQHHFCKPVVYCQSQEICPFFFPCMYVKLRIDVLTYISLAICSNYVFVMSGIMLRDFLINVTSVTDGQCTHAFCYWELFYVWIYDCVNDHFLFQCQ